MSNSKPIVQYQARELVARRGDLPRVSSFFYSKLDAIEVGKLWAPSKYKIVKTTTQVVGFYGGRGEE
jgi:hypothetical protein